MDIKIKKRLLWAILLSICFMIFLLARVELKHFSLIAGRVDVAVLITAFGVFVLGNFIRAIRFHKLDHTENTLMHWWNLTSFYNIVTATLPGGAGEAATAYVLKRFSKFKLLVALRILLLSRLLDLFGLSVLFLAASFLISRSTPYRDVAIVLSGIMFLLSLIALLLSSEKFVLKLVQKMPGQSKFKQRVCEKLSELSIISEEQRKNNTLGMTLLQSMLMMIVGVISIHLTLRAFGVDFTLVQSTYCYGIYMVFQIIPLQGIAGIGTQAAWWLLALNAAGYRTPDGIALGIVLHGTFYAFIAIIGLSALLMWFAGRKSDGL